MWCDKGYGIELSTLEGEDLENRTLFDRINKRSADLGVNSATGAQSHNELSVQSLSQDWGIHMEEGSFILAEWVFFRLFFSNWSKVWTVSSPSRNGVVSRVQVRCMLNAIYRDVIPCNNCWVYCYLTDIKHYRNRYTCSSSKQLPCNIHLKKGQDVSCRVMLTQTLSLTKPEFCRFER
ncbi:T-complex protein 1 subunit beta [Platysternon megacephalum]|uniref:T-complex protein 1 subunit beta n=1 Tax=Platysternon megacephalum TaxID=55544 RepID=A0A4D9EKA5_9SAUR|nr:T-complex protein 1 subunit beta [Platysternon megacephalum]